MTRLVRGVEAGTGASEVAGHRRPAEFPQSGTLINMAPPDDADQSTWQRFLGGKTGPQRFMLALGALAGAALAIGAVIAGAFTLLDDESEQRAGPTNGKVQRIENQTEQADDFVEFLLGAAGGAPVKLNHQVLTPKGDGHFR